MREILFRGKRVDGYGWIYGGLIYDEAEYNQPRIVIGREYSTGTFFNAQAPRVMRDTVGQYTGLTDKNGKKIFEGDIVQGTIVSAWNKALIRCEVVYNKDSFISVERTRNQDRVHKVKFAKDIEVIGNIYDNPELLGE